MVSECMLGKGLCVSELREFKSDGIYGIFAIIFLFYLLVALRSEVSSWYT